MSADLEKAWNWREARGMKGEFTDALRVFHGPGEGNGALRQVSIDRFGDHYWITEWESKKSDPKSSQSIPLDTIKSFLEKKGARSAVKLFRPGKGLPDEVRPFLGDAPSEQFVATEMGAKFWIRFRDVRHPGLFLDHAPLRSWLKQRTLGLKVLNTFAYTGSLSIASGLGGASHVTTLDLSNPTIRWAEENWSLNGLAPSQARFIAGDVFEWLPRLKREGALFDCIILDPPSFSHGTKARFSTAKDLEKLHTLALDLIAPGGVLATSINSANVTWNQFDTDLLAAARAKKVTFEVLGRIDLPDTFPTRLGSQEDRYLKGYILRSTR